MLILSLACYDCIKEFADVFPHTRTNTDSVRPTSQKTIWDYKDSFFDQVDQSVFEQFAMSVNFF
ncbi:hypothetical protein MSKU15_3504 [Komagataeibacter diospyri]|nr:hypothetical protein MSKU15_3504 [Komagataeibacter diospyri]